MPGSTRRSFFHLVGGCATGAVTVQLGQLLPTGGYVSTRFRAEVRGRLVWIAELSPEPNVVHAQYAYYPYQYQNPYAYYGQYQMWAAGQWYQQQYQAYMQQLVQQNTWARSYVSPMASYMQQYANSYSLSEPFAMESIRSLYTYGDGDPGEDDLILGLNKNGRRVLARGKSVRAMSAISDIADSEDWDDEEKEASSGPQSSSRTRSVQVGSKRISGSGFDTENGEAFVSSRRYRNEDSGEEGSLIVFDTSENKEVRLVEV